MDEMENSASENICKGCGKYAVDNAEHKNSVLCAECRERHLKYPFPKWVVAFAVVLLLAAAYGFWSLYQAVPDFLLVERANRAYNEERYFTAYMGYIEFLGAREDTIEKKQHKQIGRKLFDCAMRIGAYDTAAYAFDTFYYGDEVGDKEYDRVKRQCEKLDAYYLAYDFFAEAGVMDAETAEEAAALSEAALAGAAPGLADNATYLYMRAELYASAEDYAKILEDLKSVERADPDYPTLYARMAGICRRTGDWGAARAYVAKALSMVKDDPEAYRQLSVLDMLEGDYAAAAENAGKMYDIAPYWGFAADTVATARALNGEDTADVVAFARENELDISDYEAFADGRKTLEEIYLD